MDFNKLKLYFNTVIYLKPVQVFYRTYYFIRNKFFNVKVYKKLNFERKPINWNDKLFSNTSYLYKTKTFKFLNISHKFLDNTDWNYSNYGKLWTYNLNYFDFLNQNNLPEKVGLELINNYVKNDKILKEGKEPYTISLRTINWIKFLTKKKINNKIINDTLYTHCKILLKNLEYHLLGNHLLENAFSLLFGAYYFQDKKLYKCSKKILLKQLDEQILNDGAHFELSPMYHQIILSRLLDSIQLIKINNTWKKDNLISFLKQKSSLMISWLYNITYSNGEIPMVNDATYKIAPNSKELFAYAEYLGINSQDVPLSDSGYRKINSINYELLIDIGKVGPSYQPGHAHSDTFNFELIKNGIPVFVDTGISTYEKNSNRQKQRSTYSHNTVKIGSKDQTQVWGGFRVAKRAKITHLIEKTNLIEASHDGYLSDGYNHTRSFLWGEKELILIDKINKSTSNNAKAFFHLHSSVIKPLVEGNYVMLESLGLSIKFDKASSVEIEKYQLSEGFNKSSLAYKIVVIFDQILKTKISL